MKSALRISGIYVVVASLWIVLSDRLVLLLAPDLTKLALFSTLKGIAFVITTGALLFFLIQNALSAKRKVIDDLNRMVNLKQQLIRELHHRNRNNIQVLQGLLALESKERLNNRLSSMASVYEVVYDHKEIESLDLSDVLARYCDSAPRKLTVLDAVTNSKTTIEFLVTLLLVIDALVDAIRAQGFSQVIGIRPQSSRVLDLELACEGSCPDLNLRADDPFVTIYLKYIDGRLEYLPESGTVRLHYRNRGEA